MYIYIYQSKQCKYINIYPNKACVLKTNQMTQDHPYNVHSLNLPKMGHFNHPHPRPQVCLPWEGWENIKEATREKRVESKKHHDYYDIYD